MCATRPYRADMKENSSKVISLGGDSMARHELVSLGEIKAILAEHFDAPGHLGLTKSGWSKAISGSVCGDVWIYVWIDIYKVRGAVTVEHLVTSFRGLREFQETIEAFSAAEVVSCEYDASGKPVQVVLHAPRRQDQIVLEDAGYDFEDQPEPARLFARGLIRRGRRVTSEGA